MKQKLILFAIAALLTSCTLENYRKTGLEGSSMPDIEILLPDSVTRFNMKRVEIGKPSVVFLFNPNCVFCKAQTREMVEASKLNAFQLLFVTSYSFDEMKKYRNDFQLQKYPNIIVGYDSALTSGDYYKATNVPFTAIYDKDRKLKRAYMGRINIKTITDAIGRD